jgi:hypothetical protein
VVDGALDKIYGRDRTLIMSTFALFIYGTLTAAGERWWIKIYS